MVWDLSSPLASFCWHTGCREQRAIFWASGALTGSLGIASIVLLSGVDAPYGRYNQASEKQSKSRVMQALSACDVPAKVAWVLQECPTLIAASVCWAYGNTECKKNLGNVFSLSCFVLHYINRALIYPFQLKGSKPIPLSVMLMAMSFCTVNGFIQCRSLTNYVLVPTKSWTMPVGLSLWGIGLYINSQSDRILRELRKPGETGYKIPYGGMFEYVSGANFFGEIVEWIGYAVACGGALPSVAFALSTLFNIGPRAIAHHKWYLNKFQDEYPKKRKALIPFIL